MPVEEVGWGGMSLVTRVLTDQGLWELRKEPLPKFYGDQLVTDRFTREFEILKELSHPGIIKAFRCEDRHVTKEIVIPSLILEEVDGCSLHDLSDFLKDLTLPSFEGWIQAFLGQMVSILRYMNSRVIHGDLSPENILISRDGWVKVIDFGTAKKTGERSSFRIAGRPYFRSPEVMATGHASERDDVFALGRILRWCLQWRDSESEAATLAPIIDQLEERRVLDGLPEYFQPLMIPATIASGRRLSQITEVKAEPWRKWVSYGMRASCWIVLGAFISSWMPQRAIIDVNSRPFTRFTLEHEPGKVFETPARMLRVPSGRIIVYFQDPLKPQKMLRREIVAEPLGRTRIFEDFGKH